VSKIRELVREAHVSAENHPVNQQFINGSISDEAYNLYVYQRSLIMRFLDGFLPEKFARYEKFEKDLPENHGLPVLQATQDYLNYLEGVEEENMIAHIYVNYMGDAHGGQIIRHNNPNRSNHHLDFDGFRSEFLNYVRGQMKGKDEDLAEQANNAFNFIECILDDVQDMVSDADT